MEAVKTIKFVVRCEGAEPRVVVIDEVEADFIRIGRDSRSHLILQHASVSLMHAIVTMEKGQAVVIDLGSGAGTFVNELEINKYRLADQDVLGIGPYQIQVFFNQTDEGVSKEQSSSEGSGDVAVPDRTIGFLICHGEVVEKKIFPVRRKSESEPFGLKISSHSDADIRLCGDRVVGAHALIYCSGDGGFLFANVSVVVPMSLNGVVFSEHMQTGQLKTGDVISLEDYRITVFIDSEVEAVRTAKQEENPEQEIARLRRELAEAIAEITMLRARLDSLTPFSLQGIVDVVSPTVERVAGELRQDLGALGGLLKRFRRGRPDKPKV